MGSLGSQIFPLISLLGVFTGYKCAVQGPARGAAEVEIRAVPEAAVEYGNRTRAARQMYLVGVVRQAIGN